MTEEIKEKEFKGRVGTIDPATRILNMKDSEDVTHPFKWTEPLDVLIRKQKPGYYLTVKFDDETRIIKNASYWQEGRDAMPKKDGIKGNWQPKKPRVTIAATVNLQNYENIKVEVESNSAEESTKIMIDTLKGFAANPKYCTTKDMIDSYLARVLNTGV